jgi:hypothetical protein
MSVLQRGGVLVAVGFLVGSPLAWSESREGPTTRLSPELRAAFVAEMQNLDSALQRAVSAVARADWASAERVGNEIRGSFILEQRLTPDQLTELHRVLPAPFLALDRAFHAQAERLTLAAKSADAELAAFSIYKLTEACISCHAQFAQHRFQGLSPPDAVHHH